MLRLFIAIQLPLPLRARVEQLQRQWQTQLDARSVRWVPSAQIHLTLKFLGAVAESEATQITTALRQACDRIKPFELSLRGAGCFPDLRRPRIVWVGAACRTNILQQLQRAIAAATQGWGKSDDREFHPHITVGRVKEIRARDTRELGRILEHSAAEELGAWRVEAVELVQSELLADGPRYRTVAAVGMN